MKRQKKVPTNFNEEKLACKARKKNILLTFLLITIVLLIVVSIYCHWIKYRVKQKTLPFHVTNNELKKVIYWYHKFKMSNKFKDTDIKNHT